MVPPNTLNLETPAADDGDHARWFLDEVETHGGALKRYLRGSFPAVGDVEDVVQESFLRVWRAKTAQPIASAKAFLFTVARRVALDTIRHNRRSPMVQVGDLSGLSVIEERADAAEAVCLQEKIDLLGSAIAALAPRRREIVILRKFRHLSQREVAERLGISEHTVENQLHRGIRQCEEFLRARGLTSFHRHDAR